MNDKTVIKIADALEVPLFKKYWPIGGFYWNKNHMDKNSLKDLELLIQRSKKSSENRKYVVIDHLMVICILYLSGTISFNGFLATLPFIFIIHGYMFIVYAYNIIKAEERIEFLQNHPIENEEISEEEIKMKEVNKWNKDQEIQIYYQMGSTYRLTSQKIKSQFGPALEDFKKILAFRDYYTIEWKKSGLELGEFLYIRDFEKIYEAFRQTYK